MNQRSQNENRLLQILGEGNIPAAQEALLAWVPADYYEKLRHLFCQAKTRLYQNSYLKALELLQAYDQQLPEDLDVLCDIILCLYQLGMQKEMSQQVLKALTLLKQQSNKRDIHNPAIFLAKIQEEQGLYSAAQETLSWVQSSALNPKQKKDLDIQMLRLSVELQDYKAAKELYDNVIFGIEHSLNFEVEREHALLLADALLLGFPAAKERYDYILSKKPSLADLHFLKGEMAELTILNKRFAELEAFRIDEELQNSYEKEQAKLIKCYLSGQSNPDFSVVRMEKILSMMSLLRLIAQAILLFPQADGREQWIERYRFHILKLPLKAIQGIYLNRIATREDRVLADFQSKVFTINGKEVALKNALLWDLLRSFASGQQEKSLDDVISDIYNEQPNTQHFDRLRIGIYRLNSLLAEKAQLPPLFQISKHKVTQLFLVEERK